MNIKRILLLNGIFFIGMGLTAAQDTDYFSPDNILRFAEYLYQNGEYRRAASEFQRYLLIQENLPADAESILYRIAICHKEAKEYPKAIEIFRRIEKEYPEGSFSDQCPYQEALCYFFSEKYDVSFNLCKQSLDRIDSSKEKVKVKNLLGLNLLFQKQWQAADLYFSDLRKTESDKQTLVLSEIARKGNELPRKSKLLAGILSSVIPGAGKLYGKRPLDALISFTTIAVFAWQAYEGFRRDGTRSARGWIYGTLGTFFYLGNIYGSVVSVHIFNERARDQFLKSTGIALRVHLQ